MVSSDVTAPGHADLRELAEKATAGPWGVAGVDGMGFAVHRGEHDTIALYCDRDNAAYIAAASPDRVTALLDELERLRATVARVEAAVSESFEWQTPSEYIWERGYARGYENGHAHACAEVQDALGGGDRG